MVSPQELSGSRLPEEIILLYETREIPTDNPLISLEESQQTLHLNAAVVTEISLPIKNPKGEPKKLYLLDFGKDITEKGTALLHIPDIGDTRHIAVSRSRFALYAANYGPDTHMLGFCELPAGSTTTIGREATSHPSYLLGLSDEVQPGPHNDANKTLSRKQFTIRATEEDDITLEDHSTNGTGVILS